MIDNVQTYPGHAGAGALSSQRNRVLRNTYWLLALSMVPTVLGAWIGVSTGLASAMSPGIGMVVIDGVVRCGRSRNTPPADKVPEVVH